ncbi:MAG: ABC transporter substrate-binding protein [Oscillospiraceae bacterium]
MKKIMATLLAVTLTISCMVGCGKKSENGSVKNDDFTTLRIMYPSVNGAQKDVEEVQNALNVLLKDKLNCAIELDAPEMGTYAQRLPLALQANEDVAIAWANFPIILQNVNKNAFAPLDDLLKSNGKELAKVFEDGFLDKVKINEKIYAIPVNKEFCAGSANYFDKEIAERNGIDVKSLKTALDYDKAFEKIKKNEPGITPLWSSKEQAIFSMESTNPEYPKYEEVFGISWMLIDPKTDKVQGIYDTIEPEPYEYMKKWVDEGVTNADTATTSVGRYKAASAGKTWMISGSSKPGYAAEASADLGREFIQGYAAQPKMSIASMLGSAAVIPVGCKNKEKAMELLQLIYTDKEVLNLLQFGIEGKHYVKNADGMLELPPGVATKSDSGYNPGINWIIGNQYNNYLWKGEDPQKWEKFKEFNKEAVLDKSNGFVCDTSKYKNEIAVITSEYQTAYQMLAMGTSSDVKDSIARMKETMLKYKADEVVQEVQRQYDEFLKTK